MRAQHVSSSPMPAKLSKLGARGEKEKERKRRMTQSRPEGSERAHTPSQRAACVVRSWAWVLRRRMMASYQSNAGYSTDTRRIFRTSRRAHQE